MNTNTEAFLRTRLAAGIALALVGTGVANADILTFKIDATGGPLNGKGLFTILTATTFNESNGVTTSGGIPLANSSYPYYGDATWGSGKRTQFSGSLTYTHTSGMGTMVVDPFDFFSGGPAVASEITVEHLGDLAGVDNDNLILVNMGFAWNNTIGIPVSLLWDATGFLTQIGSGLNET
ncbi:MAG TPA: hypothetical protein EYO59_07950, partial [Chromatiaceae bacterium]|nr:hypothetical protein [Chromatiaceae bacterium]